MAQTGFTPIQLYSSSTATNVPLAANLANGELAINITDGKLFYKDNAAAVQVIGWKTTPTSAGGTGLTSYTAGDTLYYASGTTLTKLAIGTAYQAFQVNAGASAPSWQPSATSVLTAQGDLLYASGANTLARLAKDATATRYLSNTGTTNNPAWAQINLTNGVTGTLPVGNGGTGLTTLATGYIPYGNVTSAFNSSANFLYDGTNLNIGGSTAVEKVTVNTGNFYAANGGNVGGAGGSINFAANSGLSPMAQIKGSLANSYTSQDQGSLAFYTRPVAGSSQSLTLAVEINSAQQTVFNPTSLPSPSYTSSVYTQPGSNAFSLYSIVAGTGVISHFGFENGNGLVGQIYTTGMGTVYAITSDYRLKNNPTKINTSGNFIDSLNPVSWTWTTDNTTGMGFLAHEIQEILPNSVIGTKDAVQDIGDVTDSLGKILFTGVTKPSSLAFGQTWAKTGTAPVYQQMDTSSSEMIANIVAEIQSLRARLKAANIA